MIVLLVSMLVSVKTVIYFSFLIFLNTKNINQSRNLENKYLLNNKLFLSLFSFFLKDLSSMIPPLFLTETNG